MPTAKSRPVGAARREHRPSDDFLNRACSGNFGRSVAIHGTEALVGANSGFFNPGGAFLFDMVGGQHPFANATQELAIESTPDGIVIRLSAMS